MVYNNEVDPQSPESRLAHVESHEPPCPICGLVACSGDCDHGPGEPELHADDAPDGLRIAATTTSVSRTSRMYYDDIT